MLLPRALKGADLALYSVFKSLGIQINVVPVIMEDDYKGDEDEEDEDEEDEDDSEQSGKEQVASEKEQGASEKGEQRHPKWNIRSANKFQCASETSYMHTLPLT